MEASERTASIMDTIWGTVARSFVGHHLNRYGIRYNNDDISEIVSETYIDLFGKTKAPIKADTSNEKAYQSYVYTATDFAVRQKLREVKRDLNRGNKLESYVPDKHPWSDYTEVDRKIDIDKSLMPILNEKERTILRMRMGHYRGDEIPEVTGIPQGTVDRSVTHMIKKGNELFGVRR